MAGNPTLLRELKTRAHGVLMNNAADVRGAFDRRGFIQLAAQELESPVACAPLAPSRHK